MEGHCNFKTFEDEDKCIFHCDKTKENDWILADKEQSKTSFYQDKYEWNKEKVDCFWKTLDRYINILLRLENKLFKKSPSSFVLNVKSPKYLSNAINIHRNFRGGEKFTEAKQSIYFQGIKFPPALGKGDRLVSNSRKDIERYKFWNCYFYDNIIDYAKSFEKDTNDICAELSFRNSDIEGSIVFSRFNGEYQKITFTDDCNIENELVLSNAFDELSLEETKVKKISIKRGVYSKDKKNKLSIKGSNIKELSIDTDAISASLDIQNMKTKINSIVIDNINIEKLNFKNFKVGKLKIKNSNFQEESKNILEDIAIDKFEIEKITQDAKYIQFNHIKINKMFYAKKVEFKNTYFNDFNIKKAKIEIDKTSFIDSHLSSIEWGDISQINAGKQIFRQLKFVNDSQKNHIEANHFYAMEMKKYKEEISKKPLKGHIQEKFVLYINEKVSNFGQSYIKPMFWILFFICLYSLIIYGNEHYWLMYVSPEISELLNTVMHWLNYPLKEFKALEKFLKKDYEFMSLIFNIIFSILIWQLIVALKRYTKR